MLVKYPESCQQMAQIHWLRVKLSRRQFVMKEIELAFCKSLSALLMWSSRPTYTPSDRNMTSPLPLQRYQWSFSLNSGHAQLNIDISTYPCLVLEAPVLLQNLSDCSVNISNSVTLQCPASGVPRPLITWYKDRRKLKQVSGEKEIQELFELLSSWGQI